MFWVGRFLFRAFHEFVLSNSFVDPVSEQPAWTRRRGSDSRPICPPRTHAHLSPPGVPFSVCSHLRNLASAVDQYSSSRPASLIFDPTSECNLNKFFSSFESASCICSRERNSGRHTQGGRGGMCSDTLNPGGEVRVCCVGCILGMPEISPFAFIAASYQLHGIL